MKRLMTVVGLLCCSMSGIVLKAMDPVYFGHLYESDKSWFHEACQTPINIPVDVPDKDGVTCLEKAAKEGDLALCQSLVENNAWVNRPNISYETPLTHAMEGVHPQVISYLVEHGALLGVRVYNKSNILGKTCTLMGKWAKQQALLDKQESANNDSSWSQGKCKEVEKLRAKCKEIEACLDLLFEQPLFNDQSSLLEQLQHEDHDVDGALYYLICGVDHDYKKAMQLMERYSIPAWAPVRHHGKTILVEAIIACKDGQVPVELMQNPLTINHTIKKGKTPLHYACRYGKPQTAQQLINHKANVWASDQKGRQPIHYVNMRSESSVLDPSYKTVQTLLRAKACINAQDNEGHTVWWTKHHVIPVLLTNSEVDVQLKKQGGKTPLHTVCWTAKSALKTVQKLLELKADPCVSDDSGNRPSKSLLNLSAYSDLSEVNKKLEALKMLYHAEDTFDNKNADGQTPLEINKSPITQLLIKWIDEGAVRDA